MLPGSTSFAQGEARLEHGAQPAPGDGPALSVLMVAPSWPYPPTWGFAVRVYQLARHLAARHRLTLVTYSGGNATGEDRDGTWFTSSELVPLPAAARFKRRAQLASLASARSYHMGNLRSRDMRRAIAKLLIRQRFDIVQVESSQMAPMVPDCDVPVVLDEHNVEFMLLSRIAEVEADRSRRWFARLEAVKAQREEIGTWLKATGVVFTSGKDLSVLQRIDPGKSSCVVANGVDVEHFRPSDGSRDPDMVVFTGTINYRPNTDAVEFFNREIFAALRRLRPSTRFVVVGQGAPQWLIEDAPSGVEFTGYVDDVRPYLERAAVVVAPLRSGSGTRLKILEALAMAKPVVTTRVGCEGIALVDGEHACVADDPVDFAAAVARLMGDPKAATDMGRRGRELVARNYSWAVAGRGLEQFHTQLIRKEA